MKLSTQSPISSLLASPEGRALAKEYIPLTLEQDSEFVQSGVLPIEMLTLFEQSLASDPARKELFVAELELLDAPERPVEEPVQVRDDYEDTQCAIAPWRTVTAAPAAQCLVEIELDGPQHGNPFVDVELSVAVTGVGAAYTVAGFYDGDGRYVFRLLPSAAGTWSFKTHSNATSLDGVVGSVEVAVAPSGAHGPVHVEGMGFRHADGTRHLPLGTTCYAWTHQTLELEEATLKTLAAEPFTKVRMCVFPKSYLFNSNEPERHAFERDADGAFDTKRFNPDFFRHFEQKIAALDALGIQADVIVFHPYDRWGYADMGPVVDDRYLRYLTARLSAFPNVWWSLANEYDLLGSKTLEDWDRIASVIRDHDPVHHLMSIHNCMHVFDNSRDWVTHASMQRIDAYRTAENVDAWRRQWGKPVIVDECAYEGDIDQGWGNITAEEMTRRFWEAAVRGGWCGHSETYWAEDEVLWWSKGGVLKGLSPERIAFLRRILEEAPGDLEPQPTSWDVPSAVVGDCYRLDYYSFMRPRYRTVSLPAGTTWRADIIDTWAMTVEPVPKPLEGQVVVQLPARPYIALRMIRL